MHLADVVLQVEGGGEVGLTVLLGANQHRLLGSVDPLVPPQQIHFLEHLLACPACKSGCSEESKDLDRRSFYSDHNTRTWMFGQVLLELPPGVCENWAVSMRAAVACIDRTRRGSNERMKEKKKGQKKGQTADSAFPLRTHTGQTPSTLKEFSLREKVTFKYSHSPVLIKELCSQKLEDPC